MRSTYGRRRFSRSSPANRPRRRASAASAGGGLSNPLAAVVGGIAVGLVENIVAAEVGSLWQVPVPLAVLMVVLIVRPQGLLTGRKARTV